ncbi:hypothetical protein BRC70_00185, partial [Halobacteriales archaeon QH_6_68_27]
MDRRVAAGVAVLVLGAMVVGGVIFAVTDPLGSDDPAAMGTFEDSEAFASYVQRGANDDGFGAAAGGQRAETRTASADAADGGGSDGGDGSAGTSASDGSASRVGTTNVQV